MLLFILILYSQLVTQDKSVQWCFDIKLVWQDTYCF